MSSQHLPDLPTQATDHRLWGNLAGSASLSLIGQSANQHNGLTVVITRDSSSAIRIEEELKFFYPAEQVFHFPDWETLPYDNFSPHQDIISERLATLYELPSMQRGVLVVPVTTLMQRLPPQSFIAGNSLVLDTGQQLDMDLMRSQLQAAGYRSVNTVYEHGEYAVRGSIFDLFPMGSRHPYRIDLLDDEIDTLRIFDPETQRTINSVESVRMLPGKEYPLNDNGISHFRDRWHNLFDVDHRRCPLYQDVSNGVASPGLEYYLPLFFDECATLFDYLPDNALLLNFGDLYPAAEHYWQDTCNRYDERSIDPQRPILPPRELFLASEELFAQFKHYPRISLFAEPLDSTSTGKLNLNFSEPPSLPVESRNDDPISALRQHLANTSNRVLICAESAGRRESLIELLQRHKLSPDVVKGWQPFLESDTKLAITAAPLSNGLVDPENGIELIAESQLFGQRVMQQRRRRKATDQSEAVVRNLTELQIGAAVVHLDHGVGRYCGLQTIDIDSQQAEFLTLEYAEGAKLYVPVSSLHLISRYSGAEGDSAPLHRLGSDQWQKAKSKAAEKIRDVAAELLDIYARRQARKGIAYDNPRDAYDAFAAEFPFEETPDQQNAIAAVVSDMTGEGSMDRLVCGDVGFGKTEVAMRAAFVAVHNGHQVAMLVPTTLLAQQHFESFKDRFAEWPVTIEVLSRFRTASEQTAILQKVKEGKVDILIGTHKLLQKEIDYHQLGLLIIDEEHRFGVRQKEALKSLRSEVDILTLTATPIPRTLNMAMSGMRDLSIIATPPARRLSVKTFVRPSDKSLIKEAILREILRGGQVYYLHNEVKTIEKTARELQELLPELRIGIGHGQLRERELEQVMSDFYHQRFNLLVCSTIIETGIDVPNANTIIIDRADKFGLAQLHQLRGRVGRSHHQAYAYLLTPEHKKLTKDAEKRLEAISQAEDLGSGFTLATHDLEIRGAGELLGDDQSGQIQSIGFSLYMEMLDRAVKAIREGRTDNIDQALEQHGSEINLHLPALIPDHYLPDVHSRLILYKRISAANSDDDLRELQVEMIDRFGLLPDETKNLFSITKLKLRAQQLGISKIEAADKGGKIEFTEQTQIEPLKLVQLVQTQPATYKLAGATALRFDESLPDFAARFDFINQLLTTLSPEGKASKS